MSTTAFQTILLAGLRSHTDAPLRCQSGSRSGSAHRSSLDEDETEEERAERIERTTLPPPNGTQRSQLADINEGSMTIDTASRDRHEFDGSALCVQVTCGRRTRTTGGAAPLTDGKSAAAAALSTPLWAPKAGTWSAAAPTRAGPYAHDHCRHLGCILPSVPATIVRTGEASGQTTVRPGPRPRPGSRSG